jgi:hypothetical protein
MATKYSVTLPDGSTQRVAVVRKESVRYHSRGGGEVVHASTGGRGGSTLT